MVKKSCRVPRVFHSKLYETYVRRGTYVCCCCVAPWRHRIPVAVYRYEYIIFYSRYICCVDSTPHHMSYASSVITSTHGYSYSTAAAAAAAALVISSPKRTYDDTQYQVPMWQSSNNHTEKSSRLLRGPVSYTHLTLPTILLV